MSILDNIVADTRALVASQKTRVSIGTLQRSPLYNPPRVDFEQSLRAKGLSVIAEIKKASPSKGVIRADFSPTRIAAQYTAGGAHAISVLTEPLHFQGSLQYLADVREATKLPLLRKDFIIDAYQLEEARAHGADAVLLIAAILDKKQLYDLHKAANELNLACLVEVYDASEIDRIDFDQVRILGVNNRDLHTFSVNLQHSIDVFTGAPSNVIKVSESGIHSVEDLAYLQKNGSDAVLIGETFMRAQDPGEKLAAMQQELSEKVASNP